MAKREAAYGQAKRPRPSMVSAEKAYDAKGCERCGQDENPVYVG